MDYYQKYQKYKFKYLNLLNQYGGGYTEDEFNKLLKRTPDKTNIEGSQCPISHGLVLKEDAILIDKQLYDANELFKCILFDNYNRNYFPTDVDIIPHAPLIPHNNKRFKPNTLFNIYHKVKENYDNKAQIDFKILILRRIMVDEKIEEIKKSEKTQTEKKTDQVIEVEAEIFTNRLLIKYKKEFYNRSKVDIIKILVNGNYQILAFIDDYQINEQLVRFFKRLQYPMIYGRFIPINLW